MKLGELKGKSAVSVSASGFLWIVWRRSKHPGAIAGLAETRKSLYIARQCRPRGSPTLSTELLTLILFILFAITFAAPMVLNWYFLKMIVRALNGTEGPVLGPSVLELRTPTGFELLLYELVIFVPMVLMALLGQTINLPGSILIGLVLSGFVGMYMAMVVGLEVTMYICLCTAVGGLLALGGLAEAILYHGSPAIYFLAVVSFVLTTGAGYILGMGREKGASWGAAAAAGWALSLAIGVLGMFCLRLEESAVTVFSVIGYQSLLLLGIFEGFHRMKIRSLRQLLKGSGATE
ncbi:MAG: hypothetical protein QXH42_01760 [Thermoplasmata archaeon]